jgi:hypothetical protein
MVFTAREYELTGKIVRRAVRMAKSLGTRIDGLSLFMDIENVCKEINLDLYKLFCADDANFGHDVFGIRANMNRKTGKLENCFTPRHCSK